MEDVTNPTDLGQTKKTDQNINHDLDYFVRAAKDYSVWGMVPRNTKIGELTVNPRGDNSFATFGTDDVMFWDGFGDRQEHPTKRFFDLLKAAVRDRRPEISELTKRTNYVALLETTKNPEAAKYKIYSDNTVVFAYGFVYDPAEQEGGRSSVCHAVTGVLMDKTDAIELIEKIKNSPQLLDDLYEKVFTGLDSKIDTHTGMIRLKADGFIVLDDEVLQKVPVVSDYVENMFPRDLIKDLPRYRFDSPVGVK